MPGDKGDEDEGEEEEDEEEGDIPCALARCVNKSAATNRKTALAAQLRDKRPLQAIPCGRELRASLRA